MDKYQEALNHPFSFQKHKELFGHTYLEAILFPDGHIEYAVPSHQEKLHMILMEKRGQTREEVENSCPEEYYCSYLDWLLLESNCVGLWTNFYIGEPNELQRKTIQRLTSFGIYPSRNKLQSRGLWRPMG